MKRTAKNERTNDQNATKKRRRVGKDAASANGESSRASRRSTAALVLTCGVCVVASGCQSFWGADAERFRRGRGEYALNDANVVSDWERAARETSEASQNARIETNGETGKIGEGGRVGEIKPGETSEKSASSDPAASRPILRSAAFDEDEERRVSVHKPFGKEEPASKTFGERVKDLFSFSKKEPKSSTYSEEAAYLKYRAEYERSVNSARSESRVKPEKSAKLARSGAPEKSARSNGDGFSLGRGLSSVLPSKRRGREKFPVDPVLQYDESRFMPSFQTCEQYYSPIRPVAPAERSLNSEKTAKTANSERLRKSARSTVQTGVAVAVATTQSSANRRAAETRVSGRELVYGASEKRKTTTKEAVDSTKNGELTAQASATGWGKTRPVATAANDKRAADRPAVAPVRYLNVLRKNETDFRGLATRCEGLFGWNADSERVLDAVSVSTGKNKETLTAYSTPPSPSASVLPAVVSEASSEFSGAKTQNGGNAATLTAYSPTENYPQARRQESANDESAALEQVERSATAETTETIAAIEPIGTIEAVARTSGETSATEEGRFAQVASGEQVESDTLGATNGATLTAYAPSATARTLPSSNGASDLASQLGETNFAWFDSSSPAQTPAESATVASIDLDMKANLPETSDKVENATDKLILTAPPVDLDAALANRFPAFVETEEETEVGEVATVLPVSPAPAEEVGEVATVLPVSPAPVEEVGEVATVLPVSPAPVEEVGEAATVLPVSPAPAEEVGEVATVLPVSPAPVEEVGEAATVLPVAINELEETAQTLPANAAETFDVEAPRALLAVENAVGTENGVAGPNFALAAPGLGAGEAIQDAADERKNAVVAKPLTGDEIAWVEQIKLAIRALVAERDAKKAAGEDVRRLDARLRLLYLAVDEYDRSIQEIQDDADPLKVFWETERGELETLLQSRLEEIDPTFVAERLRAGLDSLAGLCDLQIRKSVLAVAPACFGLYEERVEAYRPGDTVFAYAELEYVSCRETENGRLIDVECRWRLLNADGSELTPIETQRCSNLSETKLRDVVLNVSAPLPNDLAPGTYILETEVVDMNRPDAKPATKRLELTVVAPEVGENVEKAAE